MLPTLTTSAVRIKVQADGNIFFAQRAPCHVAIVPVRDHRDAGAPCGVAENQRTAPPVSASRQSAQAEERLRVFNAYRCCHQGLRA